MAEQVKKASHYQNDNPLYEVWRVIRAWKLNFNRGSAVKYIARAGKKDDEIMELEKAREFLALEIEAIKAEREAERSKATKPKFPIVLEVPAGTPTEEIIQMAIKKILGED